MGINGLIGNIVAKRMAKKISSSTIKEEDVSELLREIRVVLLDSDVNIFVVKKFINNIKQKVVGQVLLPNEKISDFILRIETNLKKLIIKSIFTIFLLAKQLLEKFLCFTYMQLH